jgi:hypothetical protein
MEMLREQVDDLVMKVVELSLLLLLLVLVLLLLSDEKGGDDDDVDVDDSTGGRRRRRRGFSRGLRRGDEDDDDDDDCRLESLCSRRGRCCVLLLRCCGDFLHVSVLLSVPTGTGDLSSPLGGDCERGGLCRESLRVFLLSSSLLVRDGDGSVAERIGLPASWFVPTGDFEAVVLERVVFPVVSDDDGLLRRLLLRPGELDDIAATPLSLSSSTFSGRRCSRRSRCCSLAWSDRGRLSDDDDGGDRCGCCCADDSGRDSSSCWLRAKVLVLVPVVVPAAVLSLPSSSCGWSLSLLLVECFLLRLPFLAGNDGRSSGGSGSSSTESFIKGQHHTGRRAYFGTRRN